MVELTNFARAVFSVRANLMFVGIRSKHLGYKTSEVYILYCHADNLLWAVHSAAGTEHSHPDVDG